jgi:hypothetical protein
MGKKRKTYAIVNPGVTHAYDQALKLVFLHRQEPLNVQKHIFALGPVLLLAHHIVQNLLHLLFVRQQNHSIKTYLLLAVDQYCYVGKE